MASTATARKTYSPLVTAHLRRAAALRKAGETARADAHKARALELHRAGE
jgi:hypothetical protein